MYVCMYVCMTYFIIRLALKYTGRQHGGKVQPFPGLKKIKSVGKFKLTLIYMGGGANLPLGSFFATAQKRLALDC